MQGSIRTRFMRLRQFESAAHWRSGKILNQLVVNNSSSPAPSKTLGPAPSQTLGLAPSKTLGPALSKTLGLAPSKTLGPAPSQTLGLPLLPPCEKLVTRR